MFICCVIDWCDSTIITAIISLFGVIITALGSILMVFYKIRKQKEADIQTKEIQELIESTTNLLSNLDIVIHKLRLFDMVKENEKAIQWSVLIENILPDMREAAKEYDKISLICSSKDVDVKLTQLEHELIGILEIFAAGNKSDFDSYSKYKKELIEEMESHITKLKK